MTLTGKRMFTFVSEKENDENLQLLPVLLSHMPIL
jgi:hypothetical protein